MKPSKTKKILSISDSSLPGEALPRASLRSAAGGDDQAGVQAGGGHGEARKEEEEGGGPSRLLPAPGEKMFQNLGYACAA